VLTLRVPLSLLGNPQKALIDAQTYLGDRRWTASPGEYWS